MNLSSTVLILLNFIYSSDVGLPDQNDNKHENLSFNPKKTSLLYKADLRYAVNFNCSASNDKYIWENKDDKSDDSSPRIEMESKDNFETGGVASNDENFSEDSRYFFDKTSLLNKSNPRNAVEINCNSNFTEYFSEDSNITSDEILSPLDKKSKDEKQQKLRDKQKKEEFVVKDFDNITPHSEKNDINDIEIDDSIEDTLSKVTSKLSKEVFNELLKKANEGHLTQNESLSEIEIKEFFNHLENDNKNQSIPNDPTTANNDTIKQVKMTDIKIESAGILPQEDQQLETLNKPNENNSDCLNDEKVKLSDEIKLSDNEITPLLSESEINQFTLRRSKRKLISQKNDPPIKRTKLKSKSKNPEISNLKGSSSINKKILNPKKKLESNSHLNVQKKNLRQKRTPNYHIESDYSCSSENSYHKGKKKQKKIWNSKKKLEPKSDLINVQQRNLRQKKFPNYNIESDYSSSSTNSHHKGKKKQKKILNSKKKLEPKSNTKVQNRILNKFKKLLNFLANKSYYSLSVNSKIMQKKSTLYTFNDNNFKYILKNKLNKIIFFIEEYNKDEDTFYDFRFHDFLEDIHIITLYVKDDLNFCYSELDLKSEANDIKIFVKSFFYEIFEENYKTDEIEEIFEFEKIIIEHKIPKDFNEENFCKKNNCLSENNLLCITFEDLKKIKKKIIEIINTNIDVFLYHFPDINEYLNVFSIDEFEGNVYIDKLDFYDYLFILYKFKKLTDQKNFTLIRSNDLKKNFNEKNFLSKLDHLKTIRLYFLRIIFPFTDTNIFLNYVELFFVQIHVLILYKKINFEARNLREFLINRQIIYSSLLFFKLQKTTLKISENDSLPDLIFLVLCLCYSEKRDNNKQDFLTYFDVYEIQEISKDLFKIYIPQDDSKNERLRNYIKNSKRKKRGERHIIKANSIKSINLIESFFLDNLIYF